jgi:hypothetical protein
LLEAIVEAVRNVFQVICDRDQTPRDHGAILLHQEELDRPIRLGDGEGTTPD